ncbi:MAG: MaoC family protein [Myxococcota bacterium]|jgi:acyl dehydratase|nr:MaoC family protein [Myxococcota bacterium]
MPFDPSCVGRSTEPFVHDYNWRDVALYALGVGASIDDLELLLDDPAPLVLPTYAVAPAFPPVQALLHSSGANLVTLLHSGQRTELLRPIPPAGRALTTGRISGAWDMKIGALVFIDTETQIGGELVARTTWQLLLRGEGGFGGERPPKLLRTRPKEGSSPAFRVEVPTGDNQALLYRLSGDLNPIHSHPEVAAKAGFERPILHGLCFYGIAARVAIKAMAAGDPARLKSFEARFNKTVHPGQTLIVEGYTLEEEGQLAMTVTIAGTSEQAIANALLELRPGQ